MTTATYRFVGVGPDQTKLRTMVPASPTVGSVAPTGYVDVVADTLYLDDLKDAMSQAGYTYDSTNPSSTVAAQSATNTTSYINVSAAGSLVGRRAGINIIGANTVADNPGADRVDITVLAAAGQYKEVAVSGKQYTSIATAIAAITDATSTKQYVIAVYPGVYTEAPFSMKPYVHVMGVGPGWYDVVIKTNDNANHFITHAAGSQLSNASIEGPTGAGYAAVDYTGTGNTPAMLYNVVIRKGDYGVYCHPASAGTIHCHNVVNQYAGSIIDTFMYATSYGNIVALGCSVMSGPSGAVDIGFESSGANASMMLQQGSFAISGATYAVLADGGAHVTIVGTTLADAGTAIHVGGTGTGTTVHAVGCTMEDSCTNHLTSASATAVLEYFGVGDSTKTTVTAGTLSGMMVGANGTTNFNELYIGPDAIPMVAYTEATKSSGIISGGGIQRVSGRQIKINAGSGFLIDTGAYKKITWGDLTPTVAANTQHAHVSIDASGAAVVSTGAVDYTTHLFMGTVTTNATAVTFIESVVISLDQHTQEDFVYKSDVIGPINTSGGVVSAHTGTSLAIDVTDSTYYSGTELKSSTGGTSVSFTYWYRAGGGVWTAVPSSSALDDAYYDNNSGTLAAVPAGKFKRDLVFTSVNTAGTDYHVVYGQNYWDSAVLSTDNPLCPDFLTGYSCRLAAVILHQGTGDIDSVVDQRPRIGQSAAGSSGGITVHNDLTGRDSLTAHTQYQLGSEKNQASGYAGLDANTKVTNTYLYVATGAPGTVAVGAGAAGTGTALAKDDHNHSLSVGSPVAIGTANADGTATSAARSDHVHAHGNQSTDTLHALVVAGTSHGFMDKADKTKLDNSANAVLQWGNTGLSTTTTVRYLTPGFGDATAGTTAIKMRAPVGGTLKKLYVSQNTAGVGANNCVYTVYTTAGASTIVATLAATATNGNDTSHTVSVAAGDDIWIEVTKSGTITTSPASVIATLELQA